MKIYKLPLLTCLLCTILSCSKDSNIIDEEDSIITTVSFENADLIGTWTGVDVSYAGTMTTVSSGITTVQDIQGTNFSGDYAVTFTSNPNMVTGEGLYSISEETTESNGDVSTRVIDNLNLVNSLTNWNLVEDELTMDSSGKVITATIVELTSTSLTLTVNENTNSTINGVSETLLKNSTFTFVR